MRNYIYTNSYVIRFNPFVIILFLVPESRQLIKEASSRKASDLEVMKVSCKEKRLEELYHHLNNLLSRAVSLQDEYRNNDSIKISSSVLFIFEAIHNICFHWETCFLTIKRHLSYLAADQIWNFFHLIWLIIGNCE